MRAGGRRLRRSPLPVDSMAARAENPCHEASAELGLLVAIPRAGGSTRGGDGGAAPDERSFSAPGSEEAPARLRQAWQLLGEAAPGAGTEKAIPSRRTSRPGPTRETC